jgi:hypothetical protein
LIWFLTFQKHETLKKIFACFLLVELIVFEKNKKKITSLESIVPSFFT